MQKPSPGTPRLSPPLVLGLGILGSSTASILIRFAQAEAASLVIAAYRLGLATLILLPLLLGRERNRLRSMTRAELGLTLLSGTLLAGHFATWVSSLEYTSVASSIVLVQTAPLIVAALSPLLLREMLSRGLVAGLAVSTLGGVVVALSDVCAWEGSLACPPVSEWMQGPALKGDALALAGAVCGAGYLLLGRRLRPRLSLLPYVTLTYGVAAVWLLCVSFAAGLPAVGYAPRTYLWFGLLAVFPQLLGHTSYNWALRYLPAAVVSIGLLGEPVASIALAAVLLSEVPNALRLAGGVLTLGGILLAAGAADRRRSVQIRCYRCGWSFAIKKDEIAFALQALEQAGGGHHDVRCPRCRHTNRVSLEQLRRASPRPPAQTPQPAEAPAEETPQTGEEPAKG